RSRRLLSLFRWCHRRFPRCRRRRLLLGGNLGICRLGVCSIVSGRGRPCCCRCRRSRGSGIGGRRARRLGGAARGRRSRVLGGGVFFGRSISSSGLIISGGGGSGSSGRTPLGWGLRCGGGSRLPAAR
ncbi:unnamed protein product, partial [Ectocarpus fasciculatus]